MTAPFYGAANTAGSITNIQSPYSHDLAKWGSFIEMSLPRFSPGASQVLTSNQGYYALAAPYFWLWDITVSVLSTGGATNLIDVYTAISGGSSYLSLPIPITASISSVITTFSARFGASGNASQYKLVNDPTTHFGTPLPWSQNYIYPRGTVFSARAQTPSGGSMTDVDVKILGFVSDSPSFML